MPGAGLRDSWRIATALPVMGVMHVAVAVQQVDRCASYTQQNSQCGGTRQRQPHQAGNAADGRCQRAVGHGRNRVKAQRRETELSGCWRGLMGKLRQAQAGHEGQQAAVCHGTGVVWRACFAAKRKRDRLGFGATGQAVGAVPGGHQGECQQQGKRHTGCKTGLNPRWRKLHGPGPQPVGQQCIHLRWQAHELRGKPRRAG